MIDIRQHFKLCPEMLPSGFELRWIAKISFDYLCSNTREPINDILVGMKLLCEVARNL